MKFEENKNGVTEGYSVYGDKITIYEYEENPHGVNNESVCTRKEFLEGIGPGVNMKWLFKSRYGENKLEKFIEKLKTGK